MLPTENCDDDFMTRLSGAACGLGTNGGDPGNEGTHAAIRQPVLQHEGLAAPATTSGAAPGGTPDLCAPYPGEPYLPPVPCAQALAGVHL